jgi:hypothetical protein
MPVRVLTMFLAASLLFCADAAQTAEEDPGARNGAVFLGVAGGFYLSKERAVSLALKDAARRVSMYHQVEASIQFTEVYDPQYRQTNVVNSRKLAYGEDYEKYTACLEYDGEKDVYEEHDAVFVRARYKGIDIKLSYSESKHKNKPEWIENPPSKIEGYPAAIGFAGGQLSHKDTVIASYEDAIFALLQNSTFTVSGVQETKGGLLSDSSTACVSGVIKGFYIVETWTDPRTKAVWTLAAAREITNSTGGVR